jgi:hypothetical protein
VNQSHEAAIRTGIGRNGSRPAQEAGAEYLIAILAPPNVSNVKRGDILRVYCHMDPLIAVVAELNLRAPRSRGPFNLQLVVHGTSPGFDGAVLR